MTPEENTARKIQPDEYVETPEYTTMSIRAARQKQQEERITPDAFNRRLRILEALEKTSEHLAIELDVKIILERIAETIGIALGAKYVNFWGHSPDKKGVSIMAAYGMQKEYIEHSRKEPLPLGVAWIGRSMETGMAWSTSNVRKDPFLPPSWLPVVTQQNYHGLLCTPLVRKESTVGGMCIYYEHVHDFDYFEMSIATIVANQAATAVENARIFNDLQAERIKTTSIIYSLNDGLIMYDSEGRVLFFNPRAQELLLVSGDAILGKQIDEALVKKDPLLENLFNIATAEYEDYKVKEYAMKGHSTLTLEVTRIPVRDESSNTIGVMHVLHDITPAKELERVKSNFIATASHQMRTPLTGMRWAIDSLLGTDGVQDPKHKKTLELLSNTTDHLVQLINDLLNASRIEEGSLGFSFTLQDIAPVVEKTIANLRINADQRSVQVSFDKPEDPPALVSIDAEPIELVLQNLIDNAIKYTREGGFVHAALAKKSSVLQLIVKDNGIGIPEDEKQFIFNKFFRAKNAVRHHTDGSGLGLFIVKSILEKHDATIRFESEENKGTTFFIEFPLEEEKMPKSTETKTKEKQQ